MFSSVEKFHLRRLKDRLHSEGARSAFSLLFEWACIESPLFVKPLSRGAFSAIHLSLKPEPRPYADCEFAFKGARDHIKWYFREPAFETLSFDHALVRAHFPDADFKVNSAEATVDMRNPAEAGALIEFMNSRFREESQVCFPGTGTIAE